MEGKGVMTHQEIIAEIDRYLTPTLLTEPRGNGAVGILKALRAVVQWHSPEDTGCLGCWHSPEDTGCLGCGYDVNYSEWNQSWPCPTIKAITRELA